MVTSRDRGVTKGQKESFAGEGDGNVCSIDYDDGFTDVCMHEYVKTPDCALETHAIVSFNN